MMFADRWQQMWWDAFSSMHQFGSERWEGAQPADVVHGRREVFAWGACQQSGSFGIDYNTPLTGYELQGSFNIESWLVRLSVDSLARLGAAIYVNAWVIHGLAQALRLRLQAKVDWCRSCAFAVSSFACGLNDRSMHTI